MVLITSPYRDFDAFDDDHLWPFFNRKLLVMTGGYHYSLLFTTIDHY